MSQPVSIITEGGTRVCMYVYACKRVHAITHTTHNERGRLMMIKGDLLVREPPCVLPSEEIILYCISS